MSPFIASWGRLFRLSLAPTALGDVLAGSVLAGVALEMGMEVGLLVLASLSIYHAGMAFNDWCDREEDSRIRPDRPLPSGAIAAPVALSAALTGFVLGPILAGLVNPVAAYWATGLAACAALYDFRGRGAWLGPGLLGSCRAMNLALPMIALGGVGSLSSIWMAPLAYGVYVFLLSRLGRMEDGEATANNRNTPRNLLYSLAALFWLLPWLPIESASGTGRLVALVICLAASWGLISKGRSLGVWAPKDLIPAMGVCLRRMLPFSAALACLPGTLLGFGAATAILLLFPVAVWLRGVFPPS